MHWMKALIYIRVQQVKLMFERNGEMRRKFLIHVIIYFFVAFPLILTKTPLLYFPLPGLILLSISFMRTDLALLKKAGVFPFSIFFIEYLLISMPFLLTSLLLGYFYSIAIYSILIVVLAVVSSLKLTQIKQVLHF